MPKEVYRAGVIGLGVMGSIADGLGGRHPEWYKPCSHADVYAAHPRTELVAGATRSPQRQAFFRAKYPQQPIYLDYREMLEREQLDLVSIATPATCHAEMVITAARAGVAGIYCEKAMATSLAECDAMITTCEAAGVVLAINHQRRWDDRFQALLRLLDDGTIGSLQCIQISFGGGRLCRGGSHMFDLVLMFCRDEVVKGCGWLSNPGDFDPGGIGIFETRGEVRLVIDGSTGMHHRSQVEVIGEHGLIRISEGGFEFELWTKDTSSEFGHLARRHLPVNYPVGNPMLNAVDDLVHCLDTGGIPISSGRDGCKAFEMISAIHFSHHHNRAFVELPLKDRGLVVPSN